MKQLYLIVGLLAFGMSLLTEYFVPASNGSATVVGMLLFGGLIAVSAIHD